MQDKAASSSEIKKSLKATSIFGGVQVFGILVSIVKNKLVALLIGPVGIGIVEMYNSTLSLIRSFTDFSLHTSAVREISIAYKSDNKERFYHIATVFSRIVWFTGFLGLIVCLLGSPLWSKLSFGNYDYTIGFVLLSCTLLLGQLQIGKEVILQGTQHYRFMAISSVIGNVLGLFTAVPIYYLLGIDGIVIVLIISAAISFILSYIFASKVNVKYLKIDRKDLFTEGKGMLHQGLFLSVNFLFSYLIQYILRVFLTDKGGLDELGLFSASFAIVNTYVGLVFQAMGKEYYPRISSLSDNNSAFNRSVNDQIYLVLLIMGPLVAVFLTFSDQILHLLYSEKFSGAGLLMALSMIGVVFEAPSWCMGYVFLAKGDNKAFLGYETITKVQKIVTDIVSYLLWGLTGLGISFIISYVYYFLQCLFLCKRRYNLVLDRSIFMLLAIYFVLCVCMIGVIVKTSFLTRVAVGAIVISVSCIYSYSQINKIVNVSAFIKSRISNLKNRKK